MNSAQKHEIYSYLQPPSHPEESGDCRHQCPEVASIKIFLSHDIILNLHKDIFPSNVILNLPEYNRLHCVWEQWKAKAYTAAVNQNIRFLPGAAPHLWEFMQKVFQSPLTPTMNFCKKYQLWISFGLPTFVRNASGTLWGFQRMNVFLLLFSISALSANDQHRKRSKPSSGESSFVN